MDWFFGEAGLWVQYTQFIDNYMSIYTSYQLIFTGIIGFVSLGLLGITPRRILGKFLQFMVEHPYWFLISIPTALIPHPFIDYGKFEIQFPRKRREQSIILSDDRKYKYVPIHQRFRVSWGSDIVELVASTKTKDEKDKTVAKRPESKNSDIIQKGMNSSGLGPDFDQILTEEELAALRLDLINDFGAYFPSLFKRRAAIPPFLFSGRDVCFIPWMVQHMFHKKISFERFEHPTADGRDLITIDVAPSYAENSNTDLIVVFIFPGLRSHSKDAPGQIILRKILAKKYPETGEPIYRVAVINRRGHTPGRNLREPKLWIGGLDDDVESSIRSIHEHQQKLKWRKGDRDASTPMGSSSSSYSTTGSAGFSSTATNSSPKSGQVYPESELHTADIWTVRAEIDKELHKVKTGKVNSSQAKNRTEMEKERDTGSNERPDYHEPLSSFQFMILGLSMGTAVGVNVISKWEICRTESFYNRQIHDFEVGEFGKLESDYRKSDLLDYTMVGSDAKVDVEDDGSSTTADSNSTHAKKLTTKNGARKNVANILRRPIDIHDVPVPLAAVLLTPGYDCRHCFGLFDEPYFSVLREAVKQFFHERHRDIWKSRVSDPALVDEIENTKHFQKMFDNQGFYNMLESEAETCMMKYFSFDHSPLKSEKERMSERSIQTVKGMTKIVVNPTDFDSKDEQQAPPKRESKIAEIIRETELNIRILGCNLLEKHYTAKRNKNGIKELNERVAGHYLNRRMVHLLGEKQDQKAFKQNTSDVVVDEMTRRIKAFRSLPNTQKIELMSDLAYHLYNPVLFVPNFVPKVNEESNPNSTLRMDTNLDTSVDSTPRDEPTYFRTHVVCVNMIDDPCCNIKNLYQTSRYPRDRGNEYVHYVATNQNMMLLQLANGSHLPSLDAWDLSTILGGMSSKMPSAIEDTLKSLKRYRSFRWMRHAFIFLIDILIWFISVGGILVCFERVDGVWALKSYSEDVCFEYMRMIVKNREKIWAKNMVKTHFQSERNHPDKGKHPGKSL